MPESFLLNQGQDRALPDLSVFTVDQHDFVALTKRVSQENELSGVLERKENIFVYRLSSVHLDNLVDFNKTILKLVREFSKIGG